MTQDEKQFLSEFMEMVVEASITNETKPETELTKAIIEYVVDNGEALAPEICECQSNPLTEKLTGRYKLNAFDYSETTGILDLFGTIYYEGQSPTLPITTAQRMVNELSLIPIIAIDGNEAKRIYRESNPDVADMLEMIKEEYEQKHIELIRIFVLSNGFANDPLEIEDGSFSYKNNKNYSIPVEYHFWDMNEVLKSERLRQNNKEILIDLQNEYQTRLECVETFDETNQIKSYLCVMPAITLANIYNTYKVRLIDKNVRNFLGGKIKVNNEMAKTIAEKPELFFSYNNGISSTAADVTIKEEDGRKYITTLRNWHIVNGGQTTSTIYNAFRQKQLKSCLSKAFVAVKISEVPENGMPELVSNIAKYANSQTKIKDSDLSANAPYMIQLEEQSRKERTQDINPTYWYFERLRGQFLTDKGLAGGSNTLKVKKFEAERPQSQRFNKTDVAKLEMSWMDKPYEACKGGEVCFDKFWKLIKDETPEVNETYFHNIIAKFIIYKKVDYLLKKEGNKGHASIICAYTLALIALRSHGKLDLNYIWQHQSVQDDLIAVIKDCIKAISDHIRLIGSDSGKNPQTESKKIDFWNNIQNKTLAITLPESVLVDESEKITITEEQKKTIEIAKNRGSDFWKNLSAWGRKEGRNRMSIMEKKKIDHLAASIDHNKEIKAKLAEDCERSLRLANDAGFNSNSVY